MTTLAYRWAATSILAGYNGSCEALLRCGDCGALVSRYDRDLHDRWHTQERRSDER